VSTIGFGKRGGGFHGLGSSMRGLVYGEPRRPSHKIPSGELCNDFWKECDTSDV
jgi:hypothetical protein